MSDGTSTSNPATLVNWPQVFADVEQDIRDHGNGPAWDRICRELRLSSAELLTHVADLNIRGERRAYGRLRAIRRRQRRDRKRRQLSGSARPGSGTRRGWKGSRRYTPGVHPTRRRSRPRRARWSVHRTWPRRDDRGQRVAYRVAYFRPFRGHWWCEGDDPVLIVWGVGRAGCRTAKRVARRIASSRRVDWLPPDALATLDDPPPVGRRWWVATD